MEELQRSHLIPMQRATFECSARCCDPRQKLQSIQACTDRCQQPIMAAQQALYGEMQASCITQFLHVAHFSQSSFSRIVPVFLTLLRLFLVQDCYQTVLEKLSHPYKW